MFTKRGVQTNVRKRKLHPEDEQQEGKGAEVDGADGAGSANLNEEDRLGGITQPSKARRKVGVLNVSSKADTTHPKDIGEQLGLDADASDVLQNTYKTHSGLTVNSDQRATASHSVDAPKSLDHRSILERNERIGRSILAGELESKVYRGSGAYQPIVNRREGAVAAGKYTGLYGPVRGSDNVRLTLRIDLNPEICKDYKETGYCGFGDTCKFLHDRSDYKAGWQLEKEWEESMKQKKLKLARRLKNAEDGNNDEEEAESDASSSLSDTEEDTIPFACLICKKKWEESMAPVVTICKHYFCESCAFKHYKKSLKCSQCGTPTNGIFNAAWNVFEVNKKSKE